MENMDKTKVILIGIAGLLVILLVVIMICGACSGRKDANWNPLTTGSTTDTTDTTGNSTGDATQGQTDGTGSTEVDVEAGVVDRDEIDGFVNQTQPTTKPTTGGNSGTTQTQPSTKPTQTTTPTETTESTESTESTGSATEPENTDPTTEEFKLLTYEEWKNLSPDERLQYRDNFPGGRDAYNEWRDKAYEQYESTRPTTDGNIDLGGK